MQGETPALVTLAQARRSGRAAEWKSDAAGDWPEPADILEQSTEAAIPFPQDFACDAADRMQCPVDFIAVPLIIEAATLIGKNFRLAPKAHDSWAERPCLWGAIIGGPGTLKTPAFSAALAPMRRFQGELRDEHEKALDDYKARAERAHFADRQWKEACNQAVKKGEEMPERPEGAQVPDPPTLHRLLTGDTTQEALVDLIAQNPRGMLLFRDELSAWFGSFNQYRPGSDRQFYLECHAGGMHLKDRRLGTVMIDDLYLSICGGLQPEIVTKVLAGGDLDGMTARFSLLVWPDPSREFQYIDRHPNFDAQRDTETALDRLLKLEPERFFGPAQSGADHAFRFSNAGQEVFRDWYTRTMLKLRVGTYDSALQSHFGKYPGVFARLAIVHHLLRYVQGENVDAPALIDDRTVSAIERFVDQYLESHARRIYQHLGQDSARHGARRIAQWIASAPALDQFSARDVRRRQWSGLTDQDTVNHALDHLENVVGWIRCEEDLPGPKGGRPATRYVVNPKIRSTRFCPF
jgi:hypothetical protein